MQKQKVNKQYCNVLKYVAKLYKKYILKIRYFISFSTDNSCSENPDASTNVFLDDFWKETFNCSWKLCHDEMKSCTKHERLDEVFTSFTDVSQLRLSYLSYLAVYVFAHALHDLHSRTPSHCPFNNGSCENIDNFEPWQVSLNPYGLY